MRNTTNIKTFFSILESSMPISRKTKQKIFISKVELITVSLFFAIADMARIKKSESKFSKLFFQGIHQKYFLLNKSQQELSFTTLLSVYLFSSYIPHTHTIINIIVFLFLSSTVFYIITICNLS